MRFVERREEPPQSLDLDAITDCLEGFPIELGLVFGSHAEGSTHSFSDLDIAVLFEESVTGDRKRELLSKLTVAITEATGFEAVDLIDLSTAPPALGYVAVSEGELLVGEKAKAAELETEFLLLKLDFDPMKERWQAALSDRIDKGEYGRFR